MCTFRFVPNVNSGHHSVTEKNYASNLRAVVMCRSEEVSCLSTISLNSCRVLCTST